MKKILIVEDDLSIARLERDYLEIAGFQVEIESNGKLGLSKALENEYNLILLDIMLPDTDGFELCRQIRAQKEIPILMVTARKEDIDKIRGLGLGADDYITKPFSPGELVARIKAHLARYNRLSGKVSKIQQIQIRDLKLNQTSRRVFLKDKEILLTSKEFDILNIFMENPDRVFSKEQIWEQVWGNNTYGDISTITVHIRKMREKIEEDPNNPTYLETVWGVGYRLII